jgi:aminopeptidase-like protein
MKESSMSATKTTRTSVERETKAELMKAGSTKVFDLAAGVDASESGRRIYDLIVELYPICRSITGDGFRTTMGLLQKQIPLVVHEVPTGTQVFDWTVPREWNIRDAYVKNARGERVIDFRKLNLHVLNYSVPIYRKMPLAELREHLFTLPDRPDWVPYRTSYYKENWGFCLSHNELLKLADGEYEVCIDSSLEDGSLTYGEYFLAGETTDEILISCHSCHPSLCNDNLSGVSIATFSAKLLAGAARRYSYRFLFIPGTIGSIAWLSRNEEGTRRIRHGLVLACLGDRGGMSYKRSRRGDAEIDRAVVHALEHSGGTFAVRDFSPYGYDERQYCSPAFDLAVGCISRTQHGKFPEYHTSADNLDFVRVEELGDSLSKILSILGILEENHRYLNLSPKGEPQLGKRGLYRNIGGHVDAEAREMAMLWVLNQSDGEHSLLDIAERAGSNFGQILRAARDLEEHGLLKRVD